MKLIFMFNTKSIVFGVCSIVLRHSFTLQIYQKKSLFLHALNVDAVLAFLSLCKFIKTRGLGCTTCQWPFFRFKKRCLGYFKSEWGMAKAFSVVGFGLSLTRYVCSKILRAFSMVFERPSFQNYGRINVGQHTIPKSRNLYLEVLLQ